MRHYAPPGRPRPLCQRKDPAGPIAHDVQACLLPPLFFKGALMTIPPSEALALAELIAPTDHGIASRVLAKNGGGTVTLFAFDAGEALSEHTAPVDALVLELDGTFVLTIGGTPVEARPGTVVRMPAGVPHAVEASEPSSMLLVMLRERSA
jgi:quercetin dioxygenase-like cupin family protein